MDKDTILTYKKRWEIESMFGALKSKGFNLEESKISESKKIEKLMAFLSIAFVWSIMVGDYRQSIKPIPLKKREETIQ
jgi:sporulation-control protein spo0M